MSLPPIPSWFGQDLSDLLDAFRRETIPTRLSELVSILLDVPHVSQALTLRLLKLGLISGSRPVYIRRYVNPTRLKRTLAEIVEARDEIFSTTLVVFFTELYVYDYHDLVLPRLRYLDWYLPPSSHSTE